MMQTKNENQVQSHDEEMVRALYGRLLQSWNNANAYDYANLFSADANVIGFDGSQMNGRNDIREQISEIFASHKVASYVSVIREVRSLSASLFLLRAVAGMVTLGQSDINPKVNAIQTMIASKQGDEFSITLFQNTPAAFHGRPELSDQLTEELRNVYRNNSSK